MGKLNRSLSAVPDVCLGAQPDLGHNPSSELAARAPWTCGLLSLGLSSLICEMGLAVGARTQHVAGNTSAHQMTAVIKTVPVIVIINPRGGGDL